MKRIPIFLLSGFFLISVTGCKSTTDSSNQSPVIESLDAFPDTVEVGGLSTVVVGVSDPDRDPLSYSWDCFPGDIVPSADKKKVLFSPSSCCTGNNTITVVIRDGRGGEVKGFVQIYVPE
jgi:hypothetical protein